MSNIQFTRSEGLARITINRPARRNALRAVDWSALCDAAKRAADSEVRAVAVRGAEGVFCAGFDLSDLDLAHVDAKTLIRDHVNPAIRALSDIPVPTLALVEGPCVGGGFGIAAACDIILASETATFSAPYVKIGIMADAGLHVFLRGTVGPQRAAELIFTGRTLTAKEALAMGLCADVVPAENFESRCETLCESISTGPTQALMRSKFILRSGAEASDAMEMEARLQDEVFATKDAKEGVNAFLKGRAPRFTGD